MLAVNPEWTAMYMSPVMCGACTGHPGQSKLLLLIDIRRSALEQWLKQHQLLSILRVPFLHLMLLLDDLIRQAVACHQQQAY